MGIDVGLDNFDRFSRKVPVISKEIPTGRATVLDLYSAGGVPAIMRELPSLMNERAKTVSGKAVGEIIMNVRSTDTRVITTIKEPLPKSGHRPER